MAHELVDRGSQPALEPLGVERVVVHQQTGLPVGDDLRDPADVAGDDGRLARHRLQVDDAERLVDRRADEHRGVGEDLAHVLPGQHLVDPHDATALRPQPSHRRLRLRRQLGRVGGAGEEDDLRRVVEAERRPQQVGHALLARDATDEHDGRAGRVDAKPVDGVRLARGTVEIAVDAVVDDVHAVGIERRVAVQHVTPRCAAHGDHRVGGLVGRALRPRREAVPAAELLLLPGSLRLQRVRRDDVGDVVQQLGEVTGQVGVPRVRVHEIAALDASAHGEVGGEDAQRVVGAGEARVVLAVCRRSRPRRAEAVHVDVDEPAQLLRQEVDVHAGAAVDLGRVLPCQHADAHAERL